MERPIAVTPPPPPTDAQSIASKAPFALSLSKPVLSNVEGGFDKLSPNGILMRSNANQWGAPAHRRSAGLQEPQVTREVHEVRVTVFRSESLAPNHLPSVLPMVSTEVTGR